MCPSIFCNKRTSPSHKKYALAKVCRKVWGEQWTPWIPALLPKRDIIIWTARGFRGYPSPERINWLSCGVPDSGFSLVIYCQSACLTRVPKGTILFLFPLSFTRKQDWPKSILLISRLMSSDNLDIGIKEDKQYSLIPESPVCFQV